MPKRNKKDGEDRLVRAVAWVGTIAGGLALATKCILSEGATYNGSDGRDSSPPDYVKRQILRDAPGHSSISKEQSLNLTIDDLEGLKKRYQAETVRIAKKGNDFVRLGWLGVTQEILENIIEMRKEFDDAQKSGDFSLFSRILPELQKQQKKLENRMQQEAGDKDSRVEATGNVGDDTDDEEQEESDEEVEEVQEETRKKKGKGSSGIFQRFTETFGIGAGRAPKSDPEPASRKTSPRRSSPRRTSKKKRPLLESNPAKNLRSGKIAKTSATSSSRPHARPVNEAKQSRAIESSASRNMERGKFTNIKAPARSSPSRSRSDASRSSSRSGECQVPMSYRCSDDGSRGREDEMTDDLVTNKATNVESSERTGASGKRSGNSQASTSNELIQLPHIDLHEDEIPLPGCVCIQKAYYRTLENETVKSISNKLGCHWEDILKIAYNVEEVPNFEACIRFPSSKFKNGTLLRIPDDCDESKLEELIEPQSPASSSSDGSEVDSEDGDFKAEEEEEEEEDEEDEEDGDDGDEEEMCKPPLMQVGSDMRFIMEDSNELHASDSFFARELPSRY